MTINETIDRLKEGNNRFSVDKLRFKGHDLKRRLEVIESQKPMAVVLGCADSRIIPEIIFDTGIGELFVVRVAGNIANTSSIASIEYAVENLKTKVIVVMSHQNCGAVTAAVKGGDNGHNLNILTAHIKPAVASSPPNANVNEVARKNAVLTCQELENRSKIIKDAVNKEKLKIIPAYYSLRTGKVDFL